MRQEPLAEIFWKNHRMSKVCRSIEEVAFPGDAAQRDVHSHNQQRNLEQVFWFNSNPGPSGLFSRNHRGEEYPIHEFLAPVGRRKKQGVKLS